MFLSPSAIRLSHGRRPLRRVRRTRGGAITAVLPLLLVLIILGMACVINWGYLVLVNRDLQRKCDLLALAGAPELLDVNLLRDRPAQPQACLEAATAVVDTYRRANNHIGGELLRVDRDDVQVRSAFVPDARRRVPHDEPAFHPHPTPSPNALYVGLARLGEGNHPVRYLMDGFAGQPQEKPDVSGGAWAWLDNLVVGFRPTATVPAPLLPMAIDEEAWHEFRSHPEQRADDSPHGGNGIRELMLQLRGPDTSEKHEDKDKGHNTNAVLVDFGGSTGVFQPELLADQITRGVFSDQLANGVLGPIGAEGASVLCPARQTAGEELTAQLAQWINQAVADAEASGTFLKRALPLYRPLPRHGKDTPPQAQADAPVELVGLVACTILGAASDPVHHGLTVWVEPTYLIHDTVWTVPGGAAERNLYLYRLRLIE